MRKVSWHVRLLCGLHATQAQTKGQDLLEIMLFPAAHWYTPVASNTAGQTSAGGNCCANCLQQGADTQLLLHSTKLPAVQTVM
jgi:hypothetical protein